MLSSFGGFQDHKRVIQDIGRISREVKGESSRNSYVLTTGARDGIYVELIHAIATGDGLQNDRWRIDFTPDRTLNHLPVNINGNCHTDARSCIDRICVSRRINIHISRGSHNRNLIGRNVATVAESGNR